MVVMLRREYIIRLPITLLLAPGVTVFVIVLNIIHGIIPLTRSEADELYGIEILVRILYGFQEQAALSAQTQPATILHSRLGLPLLSKN